jgi:hypothetical protein
VAAFLFREETMLLTHFSAKPLILDRSRVHTVYIQKIGMKPAGLWLSDENDECSWAQWCAGEGFHLENLAHQAVFDVPEGNGVLWLRTVDELLAFTAKCKASTTEPLLSSFYLDWTYVAKQYKGLIITPYQWELRLCPETSWYYGWDCASGVIWDLSCLGDPRID